MSTSYLSEGRVYTKSIFGEKMTGETESEIPIKVRTQKARLACMKASSEAGQIVSRARSEGSRVPDTTGEVARISLP